MASDSLSTRVYDEILGRLLGGRWGPGHAFNRRQVAAELGVSVAPVLEAMLELRAEGLIETLPRRGTRVRALTLEDLRGQLLVREALECQAARLYCGRPVRRHLEQLLRLARTIDRQDIRTVECFREEIHFHHALVSLAGVPALTGAYERVMKVGLLYAVHVLHPDQRSAPRHSHVALVKAVAVANPDKAEAAARAHAQSGKEALFDQWAAAQAAAAATAALAAGRGRPAPGWLRA